MSLWKRRLVLAGAALLPVLLSSCDGASHGTMMAAGTELKRFQSNGERIYFTGTSESGTPIT